MIGLFILKTYRQQGLEKKLWKSALPYFAQNQPIFVAYESYNAIAPGFYASLGFEHTGGAWSTSLELPSGSPVPEVEMVYDPIEVES